MDLYNPAGAEDANPITHQLFSEQFRDVPITLPANRWLATNHESPINCMGVVYEGNYLITGNEKGDVNIWDIATGHVFRTLTQFKGTPKPPPSSLHLQFSNHTHFSRCHIYQDSPTFWFHIVDPTHHRTNTRQKAPLRRRPRLSLHNNRPPHLHAHDQIQRLDPGNLLFASGAQTRSPDLILRAVLRHGGHHGRRGRHEKIQTVAGIKTQDRGAGGRVGNAV